MQVPILVFFLLLFGVCVCVCVFVFVFGFLFYLCYGPSAWNKLMMISHQ